jgi:hypothetical protein
MNATTSKLIDLIRRLQPTICHRPDCAMVKSSRRRTGRIERCDCGEEQLRSEVAEVLQAAQEQEEFEEWYEDKRMGRTES